MGMNLLIEIDIEVSTYMSILQLSAGADMYEYLVKY